MFPTLHECQQRPLCSLFLHISSHTLVHVKIRIENKVRIAALFPPTPENHSPALKILTCWQPTLVSSQPRWITVDHAIHLRDRMAPQCGGGGGGNLPSPKLCHPRVLCPKRADPMQYAVCPACLLPVTHWLPTFRGHLSPSLALEHC